MITRIDHRPGPPSRLRPAAGRPGPVPAPAAGPQPRALFAGILLPVLLLVLRQAGGHIPAAQELAVVSGIAAFSVISTAFITHAGNLVAARESGWGCWRGPVWAPR